MQSGNNTPNTSGQDGRSQKIPSPYRLLIHQNLSKLVSVGASDYYNDACKQMDAEPPFATQSHIVGHLLREVESSLRAVLRPFVSIDQELCEECGQPISSEKCTCGRPKGLMTQPVEIDACISSLGIDQDSPIRKAWLSFAERAHKYAHRDNLELPRSASDPDFLALWSEAETFLLGVLDSFSTKYSEVFNKLDVLIAKPSPSKGDAKKLQSNFPNNQAVRKYFFKNLKNPAWLSRLEEKGFFLKVTDPVYSDGGGVYYPPWPPADYLMRMAKIKPDEVKDILLKIEDTENEMGMDSLLQIAGELPEVSRLPLTEKIKKWI